MAMTSGRRAGANQRRIVSQTHESRDDRRVATIDLESQPIVILIAYIIPVTVLADNIRVAQGRAPPDIDSTGRPGLQGMAVEDVQVCSLMVSP